jgi:hypothetical protein
MTTSGATRHERQTWPTSSLAKVSDQRIVTKKCNAKQRKAAGKILPEQRELMTVTKHIAVEVFMNALLIFFFGMVFKPF